jgi:hypothetical protein
MLGLYGSYKTGESLRPYERGLNSKMIRKLENSSGIFDGSVFMRWYERRRSVSTCSIFNNPAQSKGRMLAKGKPGSTATRVGFGSIVPTR